MFASCWVLVMLFQEKRGLEFGGFWKKVIFHVFKLFK